LSRRKLWEMRKAIDPLIVDCKEGLQGLRVLRDTDLTVTVARALAHRNFGEDIAVQDHGAQPLRDAVVGVAVYARRIRNGHGASTRRMLQA
jgi:hypothetical protein